MGGEEDAEGDEGELRSEAISEVLVAGRVQRSCAESAGKLSIEGVGDGQREKKEKRDAPILRNLHYLSVHLHRPAERSHSRRAQLLAHLGDWNSDRLVARLQDGRSWGGGKGVQPYAGDEDGAVVVLLGDPPL